MVLIGVGGVVLRRAQVLEVEHWLYGLLGGILPQEGGNIELGGGEVRVLVVVVHLLLGGLQVRVRLLRLLREVDLAVVALIE